MSTLQRNAADNAAGKRTPSAKRASTSNPAATGTGTWNTQGAEQWPSSGWPPPEEAGAIAAVLRAFAEYAHAYTPAALAATTPTAAEDLREALGEGPVRVAMKKARSVGAVAAMPGDGATSVPDSMAILPAGRRGGSGASCWSRSNTSPANWDTGDCS